MAASAAAAAARTQAGATGAAAAAASGNAGSAAGAARSAGTAHGRPASPMHASLVLSPGQGLAPNSPRPSTPSSGAAGSGARPPSAGRMAASAAGGLSARVVLATHKPAALRGKSAAEDGAMTPTGAGKEPQLLRTSLTSLAGTSAVGSGAASASSPAATRSPARPAGLVLSSGVGGGPVAPSPAARPPSPSPGGGQVSRIAVGGLIRKPGGAGGVLNAGLKPRTGGGMLGARQQDD